MDKQFGSKVLFWMVMSWASANLFAQAVYIGFNGVPFDPFALIDSLGSWYYAVIFLEIAVWMYVGLYFGKQLLTKLNTPAQIQANH
tara:strand:- start:581 stop:838 length:258 start_codon:yes stop_codon:yes gene_type:complete